MNENKDIGERYEIVILEDDPETSGLLQEKLSERNITVHATARGDDALKEIENNINVGAFLTDIEILYPYPNGKRNGKQGYDVANAVTRMHSRLLSVVVMTKYDAEQALEELNLFAGNVTAFSKQAWQKFINPAEQESAFDKLTEKIKAAIEMTPYRWAEELKSDHPQSKWVDEKQKGNKTLPSYWSIYRKLWFSKDWRTREKQIGERANEIVSLYLNDHDSRKLRGDHLKLVDQPDENAFTDHLVARRVVFALKAIEPLYWDKMILGERLEETPGKNHFEHWSNYSQSVQRYINEINAAATGLDEANKEHDKIEKDISKSNDPGGWERAYVDKQLEKKKASNQSIVLYEKNIRENLIKLEREAKDDTYFSEITVFIESWNQQLSSKPTEKKASGKTKEENVLQQWVRDLGIKKEHIEHENYREWKFLLPEERKWLEEAYEGYVER